MTTTTTHVTGVLGRHRPSERVLRSATYVRSRRANRLKITLGAVLCSVVVLPVVFAGLLPIPDPLAQDLTARLQPPLSPDHLFGTDALGRDLLSRVLYGGQISLRIGVLAVLISGVVGIVAGMGAGYFGGKADAIVSRMIEAQMSLPLLMLLLLVIAVFGPSITVLTIVLAFAQWPETARLARSLTLVERGKLYVDAARVLGAGGRRILLRHILPNIISRVMVVVLLLLAMAVLLESALAYLGLGVARPYATWGRIISDGQQYLTTAWWLTTIPGIAISLLVVGVNLLGEGIRDKMTAGRD
jgi:peptide/nickel transport system permease protein